MDSLTRAVSAVKARPILSLSIFGGTALVFGFSFSLYRLISNLNKKNDQLMAKLFSLDHEIFILRQTMSNQHNFLEKSEVLEHNNHAKYTYEKNSSDEEEEEDYFDISSDEFSENNLKILSRNASSTSVSSYWSAKSREAEKKEFIFNELDNLVMIHSKTPSMIETASAKSIKICWKYRYTSELSKDPEFLWRFGRACYYSAFHCATCLVQDDIVIAENTRGDYIPQNKNDFIIMGNTLMKACSQIYDENSGIKPSVNYYRWYIMLLGVLAEISPVSERIKYGHEFKQWLDQALTEYPNEFDFYLFRGRWSLAVYNLSWIERKLAYTIFGGKFPNADIKDAQFDFEKALELSHKKCFRSAYFIGLCLQSQNSEYSNEDIADAFNLADLIFRKGNCEIELDSDSENIHTELTKKLKEYSKYLRKSDVQ